MIKHVKLSDRVKKQLKKLPYYIVENLYEWVDAVEKIGLEEVRKCKGYHDEPLEGDRKGERSIRLSKSYRAIYIVVNDKITFAYVEEVNKHDY